MAERIRLTISVTPHAHEVFSRLAAASGVSLGRAMGDWLNDTASAADLMVGRVHEVRSAPSAAFQMYMAELAQKTLELTVSPPERRTFPPSSNTGGKSPSKGGKPGGKRP